jgi:hypothetical protein
VETGPYEIEMPNGEENLIYDDVKSVKYSSVYIGKDLKEAIMYFV